MVIEGIFSGFIFLFFFVNYVNVFFVLIELFIDVICFMSNISGYEINFGINNEIFVYESFFDLIL